MQPSKGHAGARGSRPPFIVDDGPLRYLRFHRGNVQSVMRRDDPVALCLAYTRKMMTFLLFQPKPRRMLLLGLGGGSLAKFCYQHLPMTDITVLEIDPDVMALREKFQVPPDDKRFRVVRADACEYITGKGLRQDVILADACDHRGVAPALCAADTYPNLRRRLAPAGILVMNVCGDSQQIDSHAGRIRGVFGERILSLPATEDGNLIVLAFRAPPVLLTGLPLDRQARELEYRFGLPFPRYVRALRLGLRAA